ncbi:hypothetical protein [Streptomyces lydicus]|uniref:hypothetical protein n=1 Tax=Streptomyces lydicus TaxID=47763 RepID=UPI003702B351
MAAAGLFVRRWRRPALLAVIVAGLALGGAQWIVEATARRLATSLLPALCGLSLHHKVPAYARRWTSRPLPGLRVHHGYRVYLSPWRAGLRTG